MPFKLQSPYTPSGDQPQAIQQLTEGILNGEKYQTLLGVTGSGKTFTMANVIQNVQRPTLVLTHNKTLVAQLYGVLLVVTLACSREPSGFRPIETMLKPPLVLLNTSVNGYCDDPVGVAVAKFDR